MAEMLKFTIDKFTFLVASDRWYTSEGVWAKWEGMHVVIGLSDYMQQRSGDVAFVEVKPAGTLVDQGDEVAVIETIKVNISLLSPVSGRVESLNPKLEKQPEIINQDPYEEGWLAMISVPDFPIQTKHLMDAHTYYDKIKQEAEQETRNNE
jgi:glycine cleavage system H protein